MALRAAAVSLAAGLAGRDRGLARGAARHRALLPAVRGLHPGRALVGSLPDFSGASRRRRNALGQPEGVAEPGLLRRRSGWWRAGPLPWLLSGIYEPLEGVARGNALAAGFVAVLSLGLVVRATRAETAGDGDVKVVRLFLAAAELARPRLRRLLDARSPACACGRTGPRWAPAYACGGRSACTAIAPARSASASAAASSPASRATRSEATGGWRSGSGPAGALEPGRPGRA